MSNRRGIASLVFALVGSWSVGCGGPAVTEASVTPWLDGQTGPVTVVVEGAWQILDWGGASTEPILWGPGAGQEVPFPPVVLIGQSGQLGGSWEDSTLRGAQNGGHLVIVVMDDGVVGYTAHLDVLTDGHTATGRMCDGFVSEPTDDCDSFTMTR